ncbi:hypothetical protein IU459_12600 [Nocardia amamiensis]|uniref:4Fe-4S ferredoxin-type domain-containing protein n=1 Tax=Nocardia amamiensis TaxID=404578 RepID=A0ABS0CUC7_9NOCA|nr:hypothetical protein [Nocardia amamiensis]
MCPMCGACAAACPRPLVARV